MVNIIYNTYKEAELAERLVLLPGDVRPITPPIHLFYEIYGLPMAFKDQRPELYRLVEQMAANYELSVRELCMLVLRESGNNQFFIPK